ncbi:hypothetical protein [Streptomyces mangrovisoli]|uniref:Secreted protein n=1 Tax=Streptomyces mangrovisoli TaxID=1428628 RepID=A0A1J4NX65_9ACTN|nr:hypothetical protein [Streptomyces mangrovisoli]OIJ65734.1 hypothetical protein WN71_022075 [Streptomyces mangrovisoli]
MRRGLVHLLAWLLATGAAVTLSWWGVHTVMTGTAYDPPRALPIAAVGAATQSPPPLPTPSRTARAHSSASATRSASAKPSPSASKSPSAAASSAAAATPSAAATATGSVKAYDTDGGRVVLDLAADYATLVSATPGTGWSMQVWKEDTWIRVEFTKDADKVSVICAWNAGPPTVDVGNY